MLAVILASIFEHFHKLNDLLSVSVHQLRMLLNVPVTHPNLEIIA